MRGRGDETSGRDEAKGDGMVGWGEGKGKVGMMEIYEERSEGNGRGKRTRR